MSKIMFDDNLNKYDNDSNDEIDAQIMILMIKKVNFRK